MVFFHFAGLIVAVIGAVIFVVVAVVITAVLICKWPKQKNIPLPKSLVSSL